MLDCSSHAAEVNLHLPADEISQRGRFPTIRHVYHVDASHHLEQLAKHVCGIAIASRAMLVLPGLAFV